ncbi:MAG: GNAT family N-acetyltransferase [Acidimicrobiales bacterium]
MSASDVGGSESGATTGQIIRVRRARTDEYGRIATITVDAFRAVVGSALSEHYAAVLGDVAGRSGDSVLLVAEVAGEVVGSVAYVADSGSRLGPWLEPGEAGIRMLAVVPEARGAGVGAALVSACLGRARSAGRTGLALYSTELMLAAHRLYLRAGFVRVAERDTEPCLWCFERRLGPGTSD